MANFEAMACGLPVITSDCGGVPYAIRNAALVVHQMDVGGLRDAIERFVGAKDDIETQSVRGRSFVEANYALDLVAAKWRSIIESVGTG